MPAPLAAFAFRSRITLPGLLALAVLLGSWAAPSPSSAAPPPKQFIAVLNAAQETPPVASTAQGVAHLTYTDATKILCFAISYQGLSAAEILAHIHGPALPGVPAGIVFPLPAGNPKSGCLGPLTRTQKTDLFKNLLYINIHSGNFVNGEIRGQIMRIK